MALDDNEATSTPAGKQPPPARSTVAASPSPDPRDAALTAAQARADALERKYASDMEQVANALKDPKVLRQLAEQATPADTASDSGDDSTLVDRRELRKIADDIKRTVAGVLTETTAHSARLTRSNTKELLRTKLKNFDRYEQEVDALLDKVDPRQAANLQTITDAYKLVRSQHQDEEDTERRTEIRAEVEAEMRGQGWTPDEIEEQLADDGEGDEQAIDEQAPASQRSTPDRVIRRRTGVAPSAGLIASRATGRAAAERVTWKDRDERIAASIFGITSPEEFRRYGDKDWKPDIMGFRGRDRV